MKNEFLRHTLATINYRFQKSVKDAEPAFGDISLGKGSRNSTEIINHMYDVLHATGVFIEKEVVEKNEPQKLGFVLEVERFTSELKKVDHLLDGSELGINYAKKLLQGPLSDILTHIGQLSMLRRLHDEPIEGEDFSAASIQTGLD